MKSNYIKSPLNYTGGKYKLLPQILPLFPKQVNNFIDLFCGGANVGVNVKANKVIYNDINPLLSNLLSLFQRLNSDTIIEQIENIICNYGLSDSFHNGYEYYGCESGAGLGSYNREPFNKLKKDFNLLNSNNNSQYYFYLYTLIIFAFNNQIRFNSKGQFNLPVGKRDFNKKNRQNLKNFVDELNKQNSEFTEKSFLDFDVKGLKKDDFVYCDPPYLITTASYNESGGWTDKDEKNLLTFLDSLNQNKVKFALSNVIKHKGKENNILIEWAKRYNMHFLSYDYSNSNYHGKNKDMETQEVLITNY